MIGLSWSPSIPSSSHPPSEGLHVNIKFHATLSFSTKGGGKKSVKQTPAAKYSPACSTLTGCMHFYGVEIICGDNYAEGAEAENAGMAAEHVSTQQPENSTEHQAAKET